MMAPSHFPPNRFVRATGPTTEAGKQTVSSNAFVHGLASSKPTHVALAGEQDAYAAFCQKLRDALAPVGVIEETLAHDIAADRWRLRRAQAMENALFTKIERESDAPTPAAAQAEAWIDASTGLQRIALYANRIQRAIERNTAKLEALQSERKAAFAAAREEAILLTQLAESEGETYDPAPDFPPSEPCGGFVYSSDEIHRLIALNNRLDQAKTRFSAPAATEAVR